MTHYLIWSDKVISLTGFEPVCDSAQAPVPAATEDLETRTMTQRQQRRAAGKSSSTAARTARKAKSRKSASASEEKSEIKRAKSSATKAASKKAAPKKATAAKTAVKKAAVKKAAAKKKTAAKVATRKPAVKAATRKATATKAPSIRRAAPSPAPKAPAKPAVGKTTAAKPAASKARKGTAAPKVKPARTKIGRASGTPAPSTSTTTKRSRPKSEAPRYLAAELGQPVDRHGEPIGAVSALAQGDRQLQDYAMKLWRQMQHGRVMNMYTRAVERAGFTMDDVWLVGLGGRPTSTSPDEMRRYRQKLLFRANLLEAILSETVIDLHRLEGFHPTPKPGEEAASDATATPDAG